MSRPTAISCVFVETPPARYVQRHPIRQSPTTGVTFEVLGWAGGKRPNRRVGYLGYLWASERDQ